MGDTVRAGADLVINLSASPFTLGKPERRTAMFGALAARHGTPLLFVNQVGGNDELVFDGHSTAFDAAGKVIRRAAGFAPDAPVIDPFAAGAEAPPFPTEEEAIHGALVLGLRDYAGKCGFAEAALGLSGGIDSAVAAVLATEALGPERVRGFAMPSRFSSEGSRTDARALADALGVRLDTISIEPVFETYLDTLSPLFEGRPFDVAEENLQARIRGAFLMAVSNKFGSLVLSTGNKSEIAVGYATLYGDMCGGLAPIGDLLKRRVYALARHLDGIRPRIPRATLDKPPSAELRPDQRDEDSLPPYDRLDRILQIHVEDGGDERALAAAGIDAATVERVLRMVRRAEHKRRQGPPVLKVTRKAFGRGRRLPIAADWRPPDGAPGERHGAPPTGR
jgi:NAD+ synthetase